MSAPPRRPAIPETSDEPPADEEYARTYAAGYEEGLRSGLKELLAHASRGHTNQELRALIQSRLARLAEEVDLKRRSLLAPPRPRPWDALTRPAAGAPAAEPGPVERLAPGGSLLVCEDRPRRALEVLRSNLGRFPRIVVVSNVAVETGIDAAERVVTIDVRSPGTASPNHLTPGEVLGVLKEPTERDGGALVYVDAMEFFVVQDGVDTTLRFAQRFVEQIQRTGSGAVVSFNPNVIEPKDFSRLERTFGQVVRPPAGAARSGPVRTTG